MQNSIKFSPRKELILPEYGRNIQKMIEHAVTIEDREERTRCAKSIIRIMGAMFPYLRDIEGFKYKLWDHLAIMSNFQLDVDYPFEIVQKDNTSPKPQKLPYRSRKAKFAHYGKTVEQYINEASKIEDKEKQQKLIMFICNYMKKSLLEWNREIATDKKVINDFKELSHNELIVSEDEQFMTQDEFYRSKRQLQQHSNGKKSRNRDRKNR